MTMLGLRPFGLSRSSRLIKRGFDIVATTLGLIAVAPILAVIAAAIRIECRGPVFFRQVRVGRDGQHFRIFKFRSMVRRRGEPEGHPPRPQRGRRRDVQDHRGPARDAGRQAACAAPRSTSCRSCSTCCCGEMSLVGPRPLVTDEDEQVLGLDRQRLHLTPGMTGPWQVLGARVPMAGDGRDRLPLRRRLVALGRREAPPAHRAARAARRQRLISARRSGPSVLIGSGSRAPSASAMRASVPPLSWMTTARSSGVKTNSSLAPTRSSCGSGRTRRRPPGGTSQASSGWRSSPAATSRSAPDGLVP